MEKIDMLPAEVVESIVDFIDQKRDEAKLKAQFPNKLLRDDVLEMLDQYCTVVYYPIEDKANHGFQITGIPDKNGEEQHFVFINTMQPTEIQVFTAAHELGHVWNVDDYVAQIHGIKLTPDLREKIINRFAAELLMPKEEFIRIHFNEFDKILKTGGDTTVINLLKMIAALMNHFFVPMKSVVLRMVEVDLLEPRDADILIAEKRDGKENVVAKEVARVLPQLLKDAGYAKLNQVSQKKWIEGLAGLLDIAEVKKSVSQSKIDNMRKLFDLKRRCTAAELGQTVTLKTGEDSSKDDT